MKANSINFKIQKLNPGTTFCGKKNEIPPIHQGYFYTPEGALALKMNLLALNAIKKQQSLPTAFPDANGEDLKILNDTSHSAPIKRVQWVNPNDGKNYWLINHGLNGDGYYNIKILSETGKYIKNAKIKQKKMAIIDDYKQETKTNFDLPLVDMDVIKIPHGECVARFAQTRNPFVEYIKVQKTADLLEDGIENCLESIEKDGKIDAVNISYSVDLLSDNFYKYFASDNEHIRSYGIDQAMENTNPEDVEKTLNYLEMLVQQGTRVFIASSNTNKNRETFNLLLLPKGICGTGSLDKCGKVSEFSASRQTELTQHYELGEYEQKETIDGISYSGMGVTDYLCNLDEYFPLRGKRAEDYMMNRDEIQKFLDLNKYDRYGLREYDRLVSAKDAYLLSDDLLIDILGESPEKYPFLFFNTYDWTPYIIDSNGIIQAYLQKKLCGTSFASPIRAAKWMLNESMKDII